MDDFEHPLAIALDRRDSTDAGFARPNGYRATKLHYLDEAVASLELQLSEDKIKYLEEPYVPQASVGFV